MTFDEKLRVYDAKTKRIEARGNCIKGVLLGVAALITAITGLVAVLIH